MNIRDIVEIIIKECKVNRLINPISGQTFTYV